MGLAACFLMVLTGAIRAQTLTDLGATDPTPGANDIVQLSAAGNQTFPDGLNYYDNNQSYYGTGEPGQTFTTGTNSWGYTLMSVSFRTAGLDSYNGIGTPQTYYLHIYSVSGTTATLLQTYTSANVTFNDGDWLQWSGLSIPLAPNTTYAWSFGKTSEAVWGWEALAVASGNLYPGDEIGLIPVAGGTITFGAGFDAVFDLGIAVPNPTVAGIPYYISSSSGSDSNAGTSSGAPWQSLAKVNSVIAFHPGDQILFKCGDSFSGQLHPLGSGTSAAWITIDRYGSGANPVINGPGTNAAVLLGSETLMNTRIQSYWNINNLTLTGGWGIQVSEQGSAPAYGIHITGVSVSNSNPGNGGYGGAGAITICDYATAGSAITTPLLTDILVQNCTISNNPTGDGVMVCDYHATYNNWRTQGTNANWLAQNVVIRSNITCRTAFEGIFVFGSESPYVGYNKVTYPGMYEANGEGYASVGSQFQMCNGGTMEHNEVAYNAVGVPSPGIDQQAFDIDQYCSGQFYIQYNYSHDNVGGFFEDFAPPSPYAGSDSMNQAGDTCYVRYNVSVNDGNLSVIPATSGGGLMRLQSPASGSGISGTFHFYNNTFYNANSKMYIGLWTGAWRNNINMDNFGTFQNNLFWCPHGFSTGVWNLGANDWYSGTMPFIYDHNFFYGSSNPPAGSTANVTSTADQFVNDPIGFYLLASSACIQSGINIADNGGLDFYGAMLNAGTTDIGCAQHFSGHAMLTAVSYSGPGFVLGFSNGGPSQTYQILISTNLINWTLIGLGICDGSGSFQYQDSGASNYVSRFYATYGPISSTP